jgi:hypothetical protein
MTRSEADMKIRWHALSLSLLLISTTGSFVNAQQVIGIPGSDPVPLTVSATKTAKQQCMNTCRSRYRDCRSLKQIPSSECRSVYQDCARFTCNAVKG